MPKRPNSKFFKRHPEEAAATVKAYQAGQSIVSIARAYGLSPSSVTNFLKHIGVFVYRASEVQIQRLRRAGSHQKSSDHACNKCGDDLDPEYLERTCGFCLQGIL